MKHAWEARARELAHLHAVLAARRPALVVLAGAPGMGKTTLLETWGARATALGWEVAGGDACHRVAVTPSTDERGFRAALLAARCETDDGARRARARATVSAPPARRRALDPLLNELARRAPFLVLLDDYCPNPQFAEWFEDGFLPELHRCGAPVVIGAAVRSPQCLGDRADRLVVLGKLAAADVHEALASLGGSLRPPLAPHELEIYARDARVPAVLDSLMRVLQLGVAL
jgi:AAA ATPase-like protein